MKKKEQEKTSPGLQLLNALLLLGSLASVYFFIIRPFTQIYRATGNVLVSQGEQTRIALNFASFVQGNPTSFNGR